MNARGHILLLLGLAPLFGRGQWEVPVRVALTGPTVNERQVTGLAAPQEGTDGVSLEAAREQRVSYATASGQNALSASLNPAPSGLSTGLTLTLVPAMANTGPVTLDLNGQGTAPVVKHVSQPLDSADLRPGVPVTLAWDGAAFQVLTQLHGSCPPGSTPISPDACIDVTSSDTVNFYTANVRCANANGRLCTFSEWIHACQRDPAFLGTVLNYEWVDHAANDANKAKAMGIDGATLQPSCQGGGLRVPTGLYSYRCCYDR